MSSASASSSASSSAAPSTPAPSGAPSSRRSSAAAEGSTEGGKRIESIRKRFPKLNGSWCIGIPAPLTAFSVVPPRCGCSTSPGLLLTTSLRPSKCGITRRKPVRASANVISRSMYKSAPFLMKRGCSCCLTTTMKLPGSWPGHSSALPWKTILWPSGEPFSTKTSSVSRTVLPHLGQGPISCLTIGPMRTTRMTKPWPPHAWQVGASTSMTFREMGRGRVTPQYSCSKVTHIGRIWSSVRGRCPRPLPLPAPPPLPPKSCEKKACGEGPSSFRPSSPYLSYLWRFSGSLRTSCAFWMSLKTSGSPPLSG
mmetsp:Transcript_5817/g.14353  ORF Transcript_5817/g.14353 Transcript_5817/m.14353 type:complete len:310 (+) Transcript_5817:150-1079(+)